MSLLRRTTWVSDVMQRTPEVTSLILLLSTLSRSIRDNFVRVSGMDVSLRSTVIEMDGAGKQLKCLRIKNNSCAEPCSAFRQRKPGNQTVKFPRYGTANFRCTVSSQRRHPRPHESTTGPSSSTRKEHKQEDKTLSFKLCFGKKAKK